MADILLLLGVITETGELCFNYKEGLTKPAGKRNEPPCVPTLEFGFNEAGDLSPASRPAPAWLEHAAQLKAGIRRRCCAGGSELLL